MNRYAIIVGLILAAALNPGCGKSDQAETPAAAKPAQSKTEFARLMKVTISGKSSWQFDVNGKQLSGPQIFQAYGQTAPADGGDELSLLNLLGSQGWSVSNRKAPSGSGMLITEEIFVQRTIAK